MEFIGHTTNNFPRIQIWRPSSPGSSVYNRISQATVSQGITLSDSGNRYYFNRFPVTNFIEFQPGDVIGYHQPSLPRRVIWNINTSGYTSYISNTNHSNITTIDINNVDQMEHDRQPLIELQFGKDYLMFLTGITYIFIKNCFANDLILYSPISSN